MISDITDKIIPQIQEWQKRKIEKVYPIVFIDATHFHVHDNGPIVKKAAIELAIANGNVNLIVDVEKEAPTEAQKGEVIDYTFNHIENFPNTLEEIFHILLTRILNCNY